MAHLQPRSTAPQQMELAGIWFLAEGGKQEYPEKNPWSQIEIDKYQPTCTAQDLNPSRRGGRQKWWSLRQPDSPSNVNYNNLVLDDSFHMINLLLPASSLAVSICSICHFLLYSNGSSLRLLFLNVLLVFLKFLSCHKELALFNSGLGKSISTKIQTILAYYLNTPNFLLKWHSR